MDTQTQIERLIDLAIIQRSELKKLVSELPQLREHLNAEIERVFEDAEPQLRTELEDWTTKQAKDQTAKLGGELEAKIAALSKSLEATTQTRYNAIMAERAQNIDLAKKAEDKLAEVAQAIPVQVKQIVTDELARFPRAGEIDQLRKEFAEPRGLNPRGRWQASETYNKLDLVSYNGDSYVSNTDGNREKPSRSSEAWTLSAARGNGGAGGGVTSLTDLVAVPANGELLIGNGSAFVNNTITGGTGVTVTNGPGTITIDASGAQEILTATVTNAESVAITRGQVVYLFGATGNRASVKLADNSNDAASSKTFGVVSEASIAAGANGLVTCVGVVDKLTLGSYTEGDVLYLGATPGSVTATKPYAPNHLVYVGIVERANNGNGELYVRIQNGFELDEIHDVQITSAPLAGSLLMRDATNSLWKANRLTGTANQVTVTNADTSVTLSLPTAVANVNSVTAATTQNLTLAGGSTGASLVLGQGANANASVAPAGTGSLIVTKNSTGNNVPGIILKNGAAGYTELDLYSGVSDTVKLVLQSSDANSFAAVSVGTNHPLLFGINGSERMRIATTGNLLIGTTTDSGNGKLQLATHTTSAGGIGFGTDLSLYRGNTGLLILNDASGALDARIGLYNNGTQRGLFEAYNVNTAIWMGAASAGWSTIITSGNQVPTLTLASNQAATFAGAVTVNGTDKFILLNGATTQFSRALDVRTAGDTEGRLLLRGGGSLLFGDGAGTFDSTLARTSASMLTVTGGLTTTGAVTVGGLCYIGSSSNAGAVILDTPTGSNAQFQMLRGSSIRWNMLRNTATESGSNVGSDWILNRYSDAGADLGVALQVTRSNGVVNISSTTPSTGAGSGALQVAGGIYAGAASVFAGNVTYGAAGKLYASATNELTFETAGAGGSAYFHILNPGNSDWKMGTTGGTTNFRLFGGATEVMNITTTGAATFAGAVSVKNSNGLDINPGSGTAISTQSIAGVRKNYLYYDGTNTTLATDTGALILSAASDVTVSSGKALKLGNTYTAGAPTATGYVTIKDSAGNTYKVLVGT